MIKKYNKKVTLKKKSKKGGNPNYKILEDNTFELLYENQSGLIFVGTKRKSNNKIIIKVTFISNIGKNIYNLYCLYFSNNILRQKFYNPHFYASLL